MRQKQIKKLIQRCKVGSLETWRLLLLVQRHGGCLSWFQHPSVSSSQRVRGGAVDRVLVSVMFGIASEYDRLFQTSLLSVQQKLNLSPPRAVR